MKSSDIANQRGFTLIELMIAVAVVGILAAISYPSYVDFIRKGHRNDGMTALLVAANNLETRRGRTANYTNDLDAANILDTSTEGYYNNLQITNGPCGNTSDCYTLTIEATTLGGQNQDSVTQYKLNSAGLKERFENGAWVTGWK